MTGHAYGVVRTAADTAPRPAVRVVVDGPAIVVALADVTDVPSAVADATDLEPLLALGSDGWADVDGAVHDHVVAGGAGTPENDVRPVLPIQPGDYVDFYASREHATNVGRLFRPDGEPLLPNWYHLPVGYHGRAGSIVVSGTPIRRPNGMLGPGRFGPSERLDLELELGFVVGIPVDPGCAITPDEAIDHVFGLVLVNDWSARDIQAFEYQPLGPFNGKAFATSIAPWITPLSQVPLTDGLVQDPAPVEALSGRRPAAVDATVAWTLTTPAGTATEMGRTSTSALWWTFAQQLAHLTTGGAGVRRADLFASGTISGPDAGAHGCLLEATRDGAEPVELADGTTRRWLEDGDIVTLNGELADGTPLAPVSGRIAPAPPPSA